MVDSSKSGRDLRRTVKVDADHYRSLILSKLRAEIDARRAAYDLEIEARRAAYDLAATLDTHRLQDMAYWKMGYWKMKYWKKGDDPLDRLQTVVNPGPLRGKIERK